MIIEGHVCSNFNSLVYSQCILARKAFYSSGSLSKSRFNFTLHIDWDPFSPWYPLHPIDIKI